MLNQLEKFSTQRNSLQFSKDKQPKRPASKPTEAKSSRDMVDFFKQQMQQQYRKIIDSKLIAQTKSQENLLRNFQKEKLMFSPTQRMATEESAKKVPVKGKQLSLALNLGPKLQKVNQSTAELNKRASFQHKMKTQQDESKDSYLFDTQMFRNAQFIQDEYMKVVSSNKASLASQESDPVRSLLSQSSESPNKPKQLFKRDSQSQHNQRAITVTLTYKTSRSQFQIDYQDRTCGDLYAYLKQKIIEMDPNLRLEGGGTGSTESELTKLDVTRICQFCTAQKHIPTDYYLSLPTNPLNVFAGMHLFLQPMYSTPCGKRIGLKDFTLLKCIGVGGFSRVYMVRKRDTGKFYALKLIDKKFILDNQKEIIVQNERDIMVKMENDFITPLHYAFESKYYISFVLEYCSGGELFYHLRKLRRLSEPDAKFYFVEICIGMAYLHSMGIVYRDIKPENILLDLHGHLLLSDFGLSKPNMEAENFAYSFCGSPEYMAPEMLLKTGHNFLVDCYCLGALLYELVTGLPPFYSHNTQEIYNSILTEQIQFPNYVTISSQLKDLIQRLLEKQPSDRLGMNGGVVEILTHPWFRDVDFEGILSRKIKPPYQPEALKYNFDEEEFNKGDAEFRKQFQANLQKEYAPTDTQNLVIKNFYFSRDTDKLTPNNPHFSSNPNLKLRTEPALSPQISPMAKHQSFQMQPPSSKVFQKPGSQNQLYFSVDQSTKPQQRLQKPPGKSINPVKVDTYDYFAKKQKAGGHTYSKTLQMAVSEFTAPINERIPTQEAENEQRIKTEMMHSPKSKQTPLKAELRNLQAFLEKNKSGKRGKFA